ncbi:MAG: polysaccharide deacetylase family protein [Sporomusaceae bacterium]|nr:polysaccharide deacetylase family protein [Sporomusaceae bacterium]
MRNKSLSKPQKALLLVGLLVLGILLAKWHVAYHSGVPIIAYHEVAEHDPSDLEEDYRISPSEFTEQLAYLKAAGYHTVSLHEVAEAQAGRGTLPDKPIVLSFDDGYANNYTAALPLMEQQGFRGTVFVIVNSIGQEEYLTWDQIKDMQQRGIEIGSHTLNHVALAETPLPQKQQEIAGSKAALEAKLGRPVEFLAYPFGSYDQESFALLKEAGYRGACSGVSGYWLAGDEPYRLKRVNMHRPRWGLLEFKLRLWKACFVTPFTG